MARMRIEDLDIADADIYRTVLYHFPDMVHSVDAEGMIIYVNRRAEELLGYSADELLAMNVRDLYSKEVLEKVEAGFKELKETGEKRVESEFRTRDGQRVPVEMRSFSVYDDNGRFVHTFSISRDLRAIKRLQNSLIHAGRLAAIGEMASGVAHDINNPLQVISISSQLLGDILEENRVSVTGNDLDECRELSGDIARATATIEKISNHMLAFSRKSSGQFVRTDLRKVIEEALFMTQFRIRKSHAQLHVELGAAPLYTHGSPNQLEQVFVNLITNACDAMAEAPAPKQLTIRAERDDEEGVWKCAVSDTGAGLSDSVRKRIFEAFFTTKDTGGGTGLGLSISRGIVDNHRGDIRVQSRLGEGTTFTVVLPVAQSD